MSDNNHYMKVMIDGLQKKSAILDEIIIQNELQTELIKEEEMDLDKFDKVISVKEKLVQGLAVIDDGFESVYQRIKPVLLKDKQSYKEEILQMQELISRISDKSIDIQANEERNKMALERKFKIIRHDIKQSKTNTKAAADYYKNMNKVNYIDPQFMDKKK